MSEKRKQLRWRRQPSARGLARVCQGTRGWELRYGGDYVGSVGVLGGRYSNEPWYWACPTTEALGIEWKNTAAEKREIPTADEARAECTAYVRACMKEASTRENKKTEWQRTAGESE